MTRAKMLKWWSRKFPQSSASRKVFLDALTELEDIYYIAAIVEHGYISTSVHDDAIEQLTQLYPKQMPPIITAMKL